MAATVGTLAGKLVKEQPPDMEAFQRVFLIVRSVSKLAAENVRNLEALQEPGPESGAEERQQRLATEQAAKDPKDPRDPPSAAAPDEAEEEDDEEGLRLTPWDAQRPLQEFLRAKRRRRT